MASELLFLEEVAELTRAKLSCVRFWVRTGKLPSLRPGRRVMVRRSVLEQFLADAERSGTAKATAIARIP